MTKRVDYSSAEYWKKAMAGLRTWNVKSADGLRHFRRMFKKWQEFLGASAGSPEAAIRLQQATLEDAQNFQRMLKESGICHATVNNYTNYLHSFFRHCEFTSPFERLKKLTVAASGARPIRMAEFQSLIACVTLCVKVAS